MIATITRKAESTVDRFPRYLAMDDLAIGPSHPIIGVKGDRFMGSIYPDI
jgi:hypothetical protein